MPAYCTKCGAALAEGTQFCTGCGTPAAGAAAGAAPSPTVAAATPTQQKKGPSALVIVLIVIGVVIVLGAGAMFMGLWFVARSVDVDTSSGEVTVRTPGGTMKVAESKSVTEAELGVPFYPGAEQQTGGSWEMSGGEGGGSMRTVTFHTEDEPAKVMAFYKEKFAGRTTSVFESAEGGMIQVGDKDRQDGVLITVGRDEGEGVTTIAIVRTQSHKPQ